MSRKYSAIVIPEGKGYNIRLFQKLYTKQQQADTADRLTERCLLAM
jgi:hypothetical protein